MKIAVWRYSLKFQSEADSVVGGGRISSKLVLALKSLGHDVVVIGKTSDATAEWLVQNGIGYEPGKANLRGFDGALVLTGPANLMFKGMVETYERLATLRKGTIAAYAQWDSALPFQFRPYTANSFVERCSVGAKELDHLKWHLLTQVTEEVARSSRSQSTGYSEFPYKHTRCLFEAFEVEPIRLEICEKPIHAVGYFGSDRPARMRELNRWFYRKGIPVHIYGKWSAKRQAELECENIVFKGPIPEGNVRKALNEYACAFYMADPQYIKQDFIAQRFFENYMARVPTFYSDKLQPSVRSVTDQSLILQTTSQLWAMLDSVMEIPTRTTLERFNADGVERMIERRVDVPIHALGKVFE